VSPPQTPPQTPPPPLDRPPLEDTSGSALTENRFHVPVTLQHSLAPAHLKLARKVRPP
jgi:hypothetical protein